MGFEYLIGVGRAAKETVETAKEKMGTRRVKAVAAENQVDRRLKKYLKEGNAILIKGSHSVGLEKLVLRLQKSI